MYFSCKAAIILGFIKKKRLSQFYQNLAYIELSLLKSKFSVAGSHFITVVTYWPFFEDDSLTAVLFRFFTTWVLCVLMVTMIAIDSFVMVTLIMYKYKFITLRIYLENLRVDFDKNNYAGNEENAANELQSGLIQGIVMHRDLLRLR